jgi:hypothetical protein
VVIIVKHCHIKLVLKLEFDFISTFDDVSLCYTCLWRDFYCVNPLEADKTIQAEKDETERLREEKQKLSVKHRNDPELQR